MHILIVGATRGIGRQLLEQALASGHTVTALFRNPQKLALQHERLKVMRGDILDVIFVALAMAGQEAVCCTIGVKVPGIRVMVFSEGTKNHLAGVMAGKISRADVAHFMLKELESRQYLRQTPLLTS